MNDVALEEACALEIAACRLSAEKLDGAKLLRAAPDEARGYSIQRRASLHLGDRGFGAIVGYKLGMTNPAQQAQFGISEPLYGVIHAGGLIAEGERFQCPQNARRLGFEPEIVATLADDLPARGAPHDAVSAAAAIGSFHTGIEIVEDRFRDIAATSPWVVVADGVLHRGYALGAGRPDLPDPGALLGELLFDDKVLATGSASTMFGGGPLQAVAWLANKLIAQGSMLASGAIVFCGSVAPVTWLELPPAPRFVRARFPQFHEAVLELAEASSG